ncbi:hypothetical protein H6503_02415 [Candidatus Woesearchaeota archaeon]|nr:hypothetical protein [Candidatus Woesearchaeota archaeon]
MKKLSFIIAGSILLIFIFMSSILGVTGKAIDNLIIERNAVQEEVVYESVQAYEGLYGVQFKGRFKGENLSIYTVGDSKEQIYSQSGDGYLNFIYDLNGETGEITFMIKYIGELKNPTKRLIEVEQSAIIDSVQVQSRTTRDVLDTVQIDEVIEDEVETNSAVVAPTYYTTRSVMILSGEIPSEILLDGLIGYWPFDETSGTNAEDYGSGGNNGTAINGADMSADGKVNSGVMMDSGSNQYINTALDRDSAPVTLSIWVNNTGDVSSQYNLISNDDGNFDHGIIIHPTGNYYIWSGSASYKNTGIAAAQDLNQWVHLAAVISSSGVYFYRNGVTSGNLGSGSNAAGGGYYIGRGMGANFDGFVDEAAIWNRTLNSTEIGWLYNNGTGLSLLNGSGGGSCPNGWAGSGTEGDPCQVTEAGNLTEANMVYKLQNDIGPDFVGTPFNITAENITLNGDGYTINGDDTGTDYGVLVQDYNNVTITGFNNLSGFSKSIYLSNSNNSIINNNSITIVSAEDVYGVYIEDSTDFSVDNNYFNLTSTVTSKKLYPIEISLTSFNSTNANITSNYIILNLTGGGILQGILFGIDSNSILNNVRIESNIITAYGSSTGINFQNNGILSNSLIFNNSMNLTQGSTGSSYGVLFFNNQNIHNNTIDSNLINTISNFAYGIYVQDQTSSFGNNTFINNYINVTGSVSNYSIYNYGIDELNYFIYNNSYGSINWSNETFLSDISIQNNISSSYIIIDNNSAYVNSTYYASEYLNSSANVTFYGADQWGLTNPVILRDGVECNEGTTPACYNFTALDSATVVFNVSSWSNYSIGEGVNITQLRDGLVGYWPLNETSGSIAEEFSGNNLDMTINSATLNQEGKVGTSYSFDGSTSYLNITDTPLLDIPSNISIQAWVNVSSTIGSVAGIVEKNNDGTGGRAYDLRYESGYIVTTLNELCSGSTRWDVYASTMIDTDVFVHVVMTWDGSSSPKIYFDGVEQSLTTRSSGASSICDSSQPLSIGSKSNGGWLFKGNIDEVAIWNRTLNDTEVGLLYNYGDGLSLFSDQESETPSESSCPNSWAGSGTEGDPCQVTECGYLNVSNLYYGLANDINTTVSCMNITADNIVFSGEGYIINATSNFSSIYGITIDDITNLTLGNVTIYNFYQGFRITNMNNSLFRNVTSSGIDTDSCFGLYLINSHYNNFSDYSSSGYNFSYGPPCSGFLVDSSSYYNNLSDFNISYSKYGLYVNGANNTLTNNNLYSTIYERLYHSDNDVNYLVYNSSFGEIKWTDNTFLTDLDIYDDIILGEHINITNNSASLGASHFSTDNDINSSANVTLYGADQWELTNPVILRDGIECNASTTPSCYNFTALDTSTVVFNVSSWSNYSIGEGPIGCPASMSGSGTIADPCVITTCVQLQAMNESLGANYSLGNNIDCSDTASGNQGGSDIWTDTYGFNPIGCDDEGGDYCGDRITYTYFSGTFEGNGYNVTDLFIDRQSENNVGLFGAVDNATLQNVTLFNADVTARSHGGSLVGIMTNSNATNVHVVGEVTGVYAWGTAGGLIGNIGPGSKIMKSSANANTSARYTGLITYSNSGNISQCYTTGTAAGIDIVGGIAGDMGGGYIEDSYTNAVVTGSGGGMTGNTWGNISRSYSNGVVNGGNAGGIASAFSAGTQKRILDSFTVSNVSGSGSDAVVGTFNVGHLLEGIYWYNHSNNPTNCYGGGNENCTAYTDSSYFFDVSNEPMASWDFTNVWSNYCDGEGYPILSWQNLDSVADCPGYVPDTVPLIDFISPTPDNGSTNYSDSVYLNISSSDDRDYYSFVDFDNDVVLWMRFDDVNASGDPIDNSSYGNNGSLEGDALINSSGKFGDGLYVDGDNDWVNVNDFDTSVFQNPFTFSYWQNIDQQTGKGIISALNCSGAGCANSLGISFSVYHVPDYHTRFSFANGTVFSNLQTTSTTMTLDWTHIVGKYNGSAYFLYVNGILENSTESEIVPNSSGILSLGRAFVNSDAYEITGYIDDIVVFNRSLSDEEILSLYNSTSSNYQNNFTNLSYGEHSFTAYAVDENGNVNETEERVVTLQAPDGCPNGWLGSGTEGDPCQITEGGDLSVADLYYEVQDDLTVSGTLFTINADNVKLDGNGKSIDGDGTGSGIYSDSVYNITISDFNSISGFGYGINLYNVQDSLIENLTIANSTDEAGLYVYDVRNNTYTDLNLSNNSMGVWCEINCSYDNYLNIISDSIYYGVSLYQLNSSIIDNINVSPSVEYGITLQDSYLNNISNINVSDTNYVGLNLEYSYNNSIANANADRNYGRGGIAFINSSYNHLSDFTADGSEGDAGFYINAGSSWNILENGSLNGTVNGVWQEEGYSNDHNIFRNLNISGSNGISSLAGYNNTIIDCIISSPYVGIFIQSFENSDDWIISNNIITTDYVGIEFGCNVPLTGHQLINNSIIATVSSISMPYCTEENTIYYNNSYGSINWTTTNITTENNLSWPGNIQIGEGWAYYNPSAVDELNGSANVTLYGVDSLGFANPTIYKDGEECADCSNFTAMDASTIIFNVSSWSNYSIGEGEIDIPTIDYISPTLSDSETSNRTSLSVNINVSSLLISSIVHNLYDDSGLVATSNASNSSGYSRGHQTLSAKQSYTCYLLDNGDVICQGDNTQGEANNFTGKDVVQISAGYFHSCFLLNNGSVECQGKNNYGQSNPYYGGDVVQVEGYYDFTCLLFANGSVDCRGYNNRGQSADYNGDDIIQIAAGQYHMCMLNEGGNVTCQGWNNNGQSANYTSGNAIQVATGAYHTCVLLSNGNVDCYGSNTYGQSTDYNGGDAVQVAAGHSNSCFLLSNGNVNCQGRDEGGESADYTGGDAEQVTIGYNHVCFLFSNKTIQCQGSNGDGRADNHDTANVRIGSSYFVFPELSYGTYYINSTACNLAGCNSTETRTITLGVPDVTSPTINFVSPTPDNGSINDTDSIYVNVSSNDSSNYYSFVDFDDDVVLWMRFDDVNASGDPIDNSSYGNNGSVVGDALINSSGKFGEGAWFDGTGDYIQSDAYNLIPDAFTVSAWVRPILDSADTLLRLGSGGTPTLRLSNGGSPLMWMDSVNYRYFDGSEYDIEDGNWHHIVFMINGSTADSILSAQMYVDGISITPIATVSSSDQDSRNVFRIGGNGDYNGSIDEMIVFNRMLSSDEISALYNSTSANYKNNFTNLSYGQHSFTGYAVDESGNVNETEERFVTLADGSSPQIDFISPTPDNGSVNDSSYVYVNVSSSDESNYYSFVDFDDDLLLWMRFDDVNASGDPIDNSSYGNNGSLKGDAFINSSGKFGDAVHFDGDGDEIDVEGLNGNSGSYTFSYWLIPSDIQYSTLAYLTDIQSGRLITAMRANHATQMGYYSSGSWHQLTELFTNEWTHVVFVLDAAANNGSLYINGLYNSSSTYSSMSIGGDISIGGHYAASSTYYNGSMDEVLIFNRSLSAAEVYALYNSTSANYQSNFTNLSYAQHSFTAYAVDEAGNVNETEERFVTLNQNICPNSWFGSGTENDPCMVTECGVIDGDHGNMYYQLQNDISNESTCFEIYSADVVFDGNGFALIGIDLDDTVDYGIYTDSAYNLVLANFSNISNWGDVGCEGDCDGAGIYLIDSSSAMLEDIYLQYNMFSIFVGGEAVYDNFNNITILDSGESAMYIESSPYSNISNIVISNSSGDGAIFIDSTASGMILENMTAYDTDFGIALNIDNSTLRNVSTFNNDFDDLSIYGTNNTIEFRNSFGSIIWNGGNFVSRNNITFPGTIQIGEGWAFYNSSGDSGTDGLNSTANITLYGVDQIGLITPMLFKNGEQCIDCHNFSALDAATVIFNVSSWSNYSIGETPICPNYWEGNGSEENPCQVTNSGNLSVPNLYYKLQNNIQRDGGTPFNVTADNITFDGDGYYIYGENMIGEKCIEIYGYDNLSLINIKFDNISASSGASAIVLSYSYNNTILNISLENNYSSGTGVSLSAAQSIINSSVFYGETAIWFGTVPPINAYIENSEFFVNNLAIGAAVWGFC